jgi:DNA-binding beta-propeller fold protein YncE
LRSLAIAGLCVAAGLKTGAQAVPSETRPDQQETLVWPAPPAAPAIRFVATLPRLDAKSGGGSFFTALGRIVASGPKAAMARPLGVAASRGVLYLTDPGGHALFVYDIGKNSVQKISRAGNDNLESPIGVIGGAERIFVSDSALRKIFVYDLRGRFLKTFTDHELARPTGLAFDEKSRKLYVADTAAHQVLVFGDDGVLQKAWGSRGSGPGQFNYPTHLWLDRDGSLLVVDSMNYRVQIFRSDGGFAGEFGHQGDASGEFASPKGVAADSDGHVYLVDALFDSVQIFNRHGELLLTFGERGAGPGQFWLPAGIFVDEKNRIYVADSYNQRIQMFEFLGVPERGE